MKFTKPESFRTYTVRTIRPVNVDLSLDIEDPFSRVMDMITKEGVHLTSPRIGVPKRLVNKIGTQEAWDKSYSARRDVMFVVHTDNKDVVSAIDTYPAEAYSAGLYPSAIADSTHVTVLIDAQDGSISIPMIADVRKAQVPDTAPYMVPSDYPPLYAAIRKLEAEQIVPDFELPGKRGTITNVVGQRITIEVPKLTS